MDEWLNFKTMKIPSVQLQYPLTWHERDEGGRGGGWLGYFCDILLFFGEGEGGGEAFDQARLEIKLDFKQTNE